MSDDDAQPTERETRRLTAQQIAQDWEDIYTALNQQDGLDLDDQQMLHVAGMSVQQLWGQMYQGTQRQVIVLSTELQKQGQLLERATSQLGSLSKLTMALRTHILEKQHAAEVEGSGSPARSGGGREGHESNGLEPRGSQGGFAGLVIEGPAGKSVKIEITPEGAKIIGGESAS